MADLGSAPIPALDPAVDHIRGPVVAGLVLVYTDFECPFCAALHLRLQLGSRPLAVRHFPVRSSHPRAWAAAGAAEAAAGQGRFWEMHDALFADPARLEDPHLWERARGLGLDLAQFEAERRSAPVSERVEFDFRSGVRAGVVSTPAAFVLGVDGTFAAVARDAL